MSIDINGFVIGKNIYLKNFLKILQPFTVLKSIIHRGRFYLEKYRPYLTCERDDVYYEKNLINHFINHNAALDNNSVICRQY